METPMQQLLEWIESYEDSQFKPTYTNMKEKIWQMLPKEKEVIIGAANEVMQNHTSDYATKFDDGEQYYNEKFKNK